MDWKEEHMDDKERGKRIQQLRQEMNLSQEQLVEKLNVRLAGTTEHGGFTFEPATNATTPEVIDADEPPAEEAVDE